MKGFVLMQHIINPINTKEFKRESHFTGKIDFEVDMNHKEFLISTAP